MIVTIPEVLREKLGPEGARALADLLNEASVQTRGDVIEMAASRFESRLAEEIGALRADFGVLRGEFDSKIGELRGVIDSKIGDLHADRGKFEGRMTRWMFVFWIGQIGVLLAMFFAFFRA